MFTLLEISRHQCLVYLMSVTSTTRAIVVFIRLLASFSALSDLVYVLQDPNCISARLCELQYFGMGEFFKGCRKEVRFENL